MIRIIMVALTVVLFLIFSMPLLGILGARDKKDPEGAQIKSLHIVQGVFRFILMLAGVTYEVQGLENIPADRAVLYVGNHRSYFDILVGYVTVPGLTGFVAKKEMLKIPLLRDWIHRLNCMFLDRVNINEGSSVLLISFGFQAASTSPVKAIFSPDISIWIFPEGTRNENKDMTELLPFHEGSLKIAQKSGCPVIPVAITGTARIFEDHLPFIKPSHVVIRYGEPIDIKELPPEARKFPGAYTRDVISGMLKDMSEGQE